MYVIFARILHACCLCAALPHGPYDCARPTAFVAVLVASLLLAACAPRTAAPAASSGGGSTSNASSGADTIKVGVLHSLSGTMSISETSVKDATLLAIDEINAKGGVMGKKIVPVVEDGASDWPTFAEKTKKLIQQDQVAVI